MTIDLKEVLGENYELLGENASAIEEAIQKASESETAGLRSKVDELLGEKKRVAEEKAAAIEARHKAEKEKAEREGDYEKLSKILERERDETRTKQEESDKRYSDAMAKISKAKVNSVIDGVVADLGVGGDRNNDFRDLINARYTGEYDFENDAVIFKDQESKTFDPKTFRESITASGKYDSYIRAAGGNGGGAAGGNGGGAAAVGNMGGTSTERRSAIKDKYNLEE